MFLNLVFSHRTLCRRTGRAAVRGALFLARDTGEGACAESGWGVKGERTKLSHAGTKTVVREAELPAPTGVGSGNFLGILSTLFFQERI